MKIFWSWQSDTPGKTGRFLVRDVLREVVDGILDDVSLEESERANVYKGLHLDHDRQGVSGSPDLARTILGKIKLATVVIADVTPVGEANIQGEKSVKKLLNSNVAIELGYALATVGDNFLIMVMNSFYGTREELPFDLHTKAGPIIYCLSPDADKETIAAEQKKLKADLKSAIRACLITKQQINFEQSALMRAEAEVSAKDWEKLAESIRANCLESSADSQYQSNTKHTTWTFKGDYRNPCKSYLVRAGAMLLRSPKVRASLQEDLLNEADNLTRWLNLLSQRGCSSNHLDGYSDMPDGSKIVYLFSSIRDLQKHSERACLDFANAEF